MIPDCLIIKLDLVAADKGRVFGICLAGSHLGSVIAGAIGSVLLELFGWRSLFQFVGTELLYLSKVL